MRTLDKCFDLYIMCFKCRVRAVEVPCVLNIAAVKLKSKEYEDVIKECNKILDMEVSEKRQPFFKVIAKLISSQIVAVYDICSDICCSNTDAAGLMRRLHIEMKRSQSE